jgi:hypothetical protein
VLQRQVELGWRRPDLVGAFSDLVLEGRLGLPRGETAPASVAASPSA